MTVMSPAEIKPVLANAALLQSRCFIDGRWVDASSGLTKAVTNPSDGSIVGHVPMMSPAETQTAIDAAARAWPAWKARTAKARSAILRSWFDLIVANADDLARLMTLEQGKPLAEAKGEVLYAASFVEWFSEEAKRIYGDVMSHPNPANRIVVIKQPVGVCAAITPWNFPAAMITRKVAPALAAGCVMIVKPAQQTPLTALALAVLAEQAGVPAGVLQVITGEASKLGEVLTKSEVVRKLSFTGSTSIGRVLMAQCAPTLKRLSLELGGNAPFVVFDDADLEAAVEGAVASKYRNAGQTCVCTNRFIVQDGIYDAFVKRLAERAGELKIGDGLAAGSVIGPMIDDKAIAKVREHLDDALAKGARLVAGGQVDAAGPLFFQPTVLADATPDMQIFREETFGPLAPVFRFHTEAEGIALANDTEFGLAAYFYTRDNARAWRVSEALEAGMVGQNTGLISNEVAPFGGIKQSGFGREGSRYGLEEYIDIKYVCVTVPKA